jgi:prevent-host-death family protein
MSFSIFAKNIRDLKTNLSSHLNKVKTGKEIVILDRNTPVAKIIPFNPVVEPTAEEMQLVATSVLRLPTEFLPDSFWDTPQTSEVSAEMLIQAIKTDRDEN